MPDTNHCKHCGKPMRPHAKFCPYCGEKAAVEGSSGILSFDDFFEDYGDTRGKEDKEIKESLQEADTEKPAEPVPDKDKTPPSSKTPQEEPEEDTETTAKESPKTIFTFRDKEKKKRVKVLDDTLELPIEEIQREIARRRERERMEQRSPEEKEASKKELEGVYDQLRKRHAKEDVLIPESEIVKDEDRPEKRSLLSRARDYLLGVDIDDIEGVDVKKEEAIEQEKARRAARREAKKSAPIAEKPDEQTEEKQSVFAAKTEEDTSAKEEPAEEKEKRSWRSFFGIQEEEPADAAETKKEEPVFSVPKETEEPAVPSPDEEVRKTTWFGTLRDKKRDRKEEQMVILPDGEKDKAPAEEESLFVPDTEEAEAAKDEKKRRRNIILGVAAALLLVAGLGLFFAGNYMTDPLRLSESFASAVEAEDQDTIAKMLHADGVEINTEKLGPFYDLLKDPAYKTALLASLQTFSEEDGRSEDADVWIEETGSRYLFFNAYQMNIKTFSVQPEVSYADTMVSVDGGEPVLVSPENPVQIDALLPGLHRLNAVYDKGINPVHAASDIELTTSNEALQENALTVDLTNPGKFARFTSPQEDAVVLINGQEQGKAKDLANTRFGPFEEPVEVQLRLDTPIGAVTSDKKNATEDGQILDFTFANMVEISDYHDEATIYLNGESTGAKGKDFIPFGRLLGPVKPEDTLQMEMEIDGKLTKSDIVTVGDGDSLTFSYWKSFTFPWKYADSTVYLDGEDTGQTVYQLAGEDMTADILNSHETMQLSRRYPWGTFESNIITLADAEELTFRFNPLNNTLYRQLQDAVVTFLEEDAFAVSNLKPNNYSNIEDPLLSERRGFIQGLIDERTRVLRVSDTANFDMGSIQFDDDDDTFYARITETYVYNYQEYEAGIFRPIRLEMSEAHEVIQHAMRYDKDAGRWFIYENRPKESMGQGNVEAIDLAY